MRSSERPYDLVLFGATGFTGQLVAEELARSGTGLRWAVAGRDPHRLRELVASLVGIDPERGGVDTIVADTDDPGSLRAMAASTRVLTTTVGPYLRYGTPVLEACVGAGTSYLDLTGEPAFVASSRVRFQDMAREARIKVVHCCGFDSVPADLGTLYTVSRLPGTAKSVRCYVRTRGRVSGGTWNSFVEILRTGGTGRLDRPLLHSVPDGSGRKALPMPVVDRAIVAESARLRPDVYGATFDYRQYLVVRDTPRALRLAAGVGAAFALARWGPTRRWLAGRIRPGEGPDEEQRRRSSFELTFVGKGDGERVTTRVSGGDPGYTETSRILAEASLLLAGDGPALPPTAGVLPPAIAFGTALIERLDRIGIRFEVLTTPLDAS